MSKKLLVIKIIVGVIILLFASVIILIMKQTIDHISKDYDLSVTETTSEEKETEIQFDLTVLPKDQRNKIFYNYDEYFRQLYMSIYKDEKIVNVISLVVHPYDFTDMDDYLSFIKLNEYYPLMNVLFKFDDPKVFDSVLAHYPLNWSEIPVTENYISKHKSPLLQEFGIKKDDYNINPRGEYYENDAYLRFRYTYGIGVDEGNKTVSVYETKKADYMYRLEGEEEYIEGILFDPDINDEMYPYEKDTREIIFNYTTDEKGYVDDITFVEEVELCDDKYLDNLWLECIKKWKKIHKEMAKK